MRPRAAPKIALRARGQSASRARASTRPRAAPLPTGGNPPRPEGGYYNADAKDPAIGVRRGEILVGGPTVARGYFVDPAEPAADLEKKNAGDFVEIDGVRYFCTGDIGAVVEHGNLKIVDRKKDLFKGGTGEYVALSKVESACKSSPYVEFPVVVGSQGQSSVVALVQPQRAALVEFAAKAGLKTSDAVALCDEPAVLAEVLASLKAECAANGLRAFETPAARRPRGRRWFCDATSRGVGEFRNILSEFRRRSRPDRVGFPAGGRARRRRRRCVAARVHARERHAHGHDEGQAAPHQRDVRESHRRRVRARLATPGRAPGLLPG